MSRRRRVTLPTGETVEAVQVDITAELEQWNEYELNDGTLARLKAVVTNIYRLEGKQDPMGQPAYWFESTNVISIRSVE